MITIRIVLIPILFTTLWLGILILENYAYYKRKTRLEIKYKRAKEAEKKKKPKEFKWPDNLPHFDIYYEEK